MPRPIFRRTLFARPHCILHFILLVGVCALLSGCGQTGPLYLPGDEKPGENSEAADHKHNVNSQTESQQEVSENE